MNIQDVLKIVLRHIKLVVIIPVVCVIAVSYYSYAMLPSTYTASAKLYVLNKIYTDSTISYNDLNTTSMLSNDYTLLLKSRHVLQAAAEELGQDNLNGCSIACAVEGESRFLTITVTGHNREIVAPVANALSNAFAAAAMDYLKVENVRIVDEALTPARPSGPARERYVLGAGGIGLIVAVLIALLLESMNTRIRTSEDIEKHLKITVLAEIPKVKLEEQ
ncbi:MAG: hypothetical protein HFE85_00710 [Clostridiales bacterium]|nr:hypothetical protein [Clostridiales bacterium]